MYDVKIEEISGVLGGKAIEIAGKRTTVRVECWKIDGDIDGFRVSLMTDGKETCIVAAVDDDEFPAVLKQVPGALA